MALTKKQTQVLREFCLAYGASGYEKEISNLFKKYLVQYGYEIVYDHLGSIYGLKRCHQDHPLKVMVCAHSDEVALKVININEQGLIQFQETSIWSQILMGQRVTLINQNHEKFKGAICATPPHLLSAELKNQPVATKNMVADFGFLNRQDALNHHIRLGDVIIVDGPFEVLNENRILAKALDNRVGCALCVELLKTMSQIDLPYDLYIGLNVQEEVGLRGATTAAQMIRPDFAIVVDCSPANDLTSSKELGQLGKGLLVRVIDGNMIAFPQLIDYQRNLCKKYQIPYQYYLSNGGTDAGQIHRTYHGVLTLTSCICARNIHSNSSIMDSNDYQANLKFLKLVLKQFDEKLYQKWIKEGR